VGPGRAALDRVVLGVPVVEVRGRHLTGRGQRRILGRRSARLYSGDNQTAFAVVCRKRDALARGRTEVVGDQNREGLVVVLALAQRLIFLPCFRHPLDPHSFPPRRSSDLVGPGRAALDRVVLRVPVVEVRGRHLTGRGQRRI